MQINPDTNHSRQTALTFFRTLKKPVCVEISSDREGKPEKDSERIPDNSRKSQSGRGGHISVMSAMNQVLAFVLFGAIAISFPVAGWPSEKLRIQEVRNVDAGTEKAGANAIKLRQRCGGRWLGSADSIRISFTPSPWSNPPMPADDIGLRRGPGRSTRPEDQSSRRPGKKPMRFSKTPLRGVNNRSTWG